ncbi:hypothetical protein [Haladaptatus sp. CMAA 1911]|uniref:hypothetical protein n=1 Tax=unclassified Haladaptatus TaxID=2622732 RepID=UPI0037544EBC
MKRRWFLVLGTFLIVVQLAIVVISSVPVFSITSATFILLTTGCAGVLFAIGGTGRGIGLITWNQFIGAADFLLGLLFILIAVFPIWNSMSPYETSIQLLLGIAAIGGLISLMFIGVDWVRGDHYFNLIAYDPGPIFLRKKDN